MGVYSGAIYNTGSYSESSIGEDMSYVGAIGAYQMMEESNINTRTIFEHILGVDFAEASAAHGYISESTFEAINEASGTGIFSKVIAFFKKLGEKIKGIIQNMIDKITAMFTKDGKQLVKKFEKQINKKMNNGDYDDKFKFKWSNPKITFGQEKTDQLTTKLFGVKIKLSNNDILSELSLDSQLLNSKLKDLTYTEKTGTFTTLDGQPYYLSKVHNLSSAKSDQDSNSSDKDYGKTELNNAWEDNAKGGKHRFNLPTSDDLSNYKDELLSEALTLVNGSGKTDNSSFSKDFDEAVFDSEEEKESFTTVHSQIKSFLESHSKIVSALEKCKSNTDNAIKDIIKDLNKINSDLDKRSGKNAYTVELQTFRTLASTLTQMGNKCSEVSTMYYSAYGAAIKKHYAQCRRVWIKAATYNKKSAKNEATLYEAYDEVSDYEVDMMMPEF